MKTYITDCDQTPQGISSHAEEHERFSGRWWHVQDKDSKFAAFGPLSGGVQGRGLRLLVPESTTYFMKMSLANSRHSHVRFKFISTIRSGWRDTRLNVNCMLFGNSNLSSSSPMKAFPSTFYISLSIPIRFILSSTRMKAIHTIVISVLPASSKCSMRIKYIISTSERLRCILMRILTSRYDVSLDTRGETCGVNLCVQLAMESQSMPGNIPLQAVFAECVSWLELKRKNISLSQRVIPGFVPSIGIVSL